MGPTEIFKKFTFSILDIHEGLALEADSLMKESSNRHSSCASWPWRVASTPQPHLDVGQGQLEPVLGVAKGKPAATTTVETFSTTLKAGFVWRTVIQCRADATTSIGHYIDGFSNPSGDSRRTISEAPSVRKHAGNPKTLSTNTNAGQSDRKDVRMMECPARPCAVSKRSRR
ncbi:hypothetical protein [Aureimonas mangrovi]|uniref:hypothetical protein n=1 Tax=Aureimonas mangrovi TaxID=2758041 RepID=UPI00163DBE1A